MAVEVFPDSPSVAMSPRISFSHDLPQNDAVPPIEHYVRSSSSSSSIDFDFCVFRECLDHESSSADELFSDGKILPVEIKKRSTPPLRSAPPPLPPFQPPPPRATNKTIEEKQNQNQKTSSFWRFKRSASLNCGGSGYATSLCPLPLLSRSNSTGSSSTASVKRSSSNNQKQSFQKYALPNAPLKQSWSTNYQHQKPPLKKSGNGYCYNGGARINPVLNVPSANLFGLGSIFSGAKDKAKRK